MRALLIALAAVASLGACGDNTAPKPLGFSSSSAGPQIVKLRPDLAVTALSAVSSLPVPTGGNSGASMATWSNGLGYPPDAIIEITGNGATTLTGPVGLYGGSLADGQEYLLGKLNGGSDISIGGTSTGYAEKVTYVSVYDYLTIGGIGATITPSGGKTVTVKAVPLSL